MKLELSSDNSVDVCVVTLRGLSQEFIDRMNKAIPVRSLIVDDHTKPLGKARESVIQKVETEKFVFLDDDVYLPENWYTNVMKYWNSSLGWIEGWAVPTNPNWYNKWTLSRLKDSSPEYITKDRGFTCDTIIRTDLVKDWVSPETLNFFEDKVLTNHVRSKGFKILRVPVPSEHRISYSVFEQAKKGVREDPEVDWKNRAVKTVLSGAKATVKTRDPSILYNSMKLARCMI